MDQARPLWSAVTIVFGGPAVSAGLDDGRASPAHQRAGTNSRCRILVCTSTAIRDGRFLVEPFLLARMLDGCSYLWSAHFDIARECYNSCDTGFRPVLHNDWSLSGRSCMVANEASPAFPKANQ